MKIKFLNIPVNEKIVHHRKYINSEDVIDLPQSSAEYFIKRGIAEAFTESLETKIHEGVNDDGGHSERSDRSSEAEIW